MDEIDAKYHSKLWNSLWSHVYEIKWSCQKRYYAIPSRRIEKRVAGKWQGKESYENITRTDIKNGPVGVTREW
jgi:hypothetical protein